MSEITRWGLVNTGESLAVGEVENGRYVLHSDHLAAIAAKDAAIATANRRAFDALRELQGLREAIKTPDALFASQIECAAAEPVRKLKTENAAQAQRIAELEAELGKSTAGTAADIARCFAVFRQMPDENDGKEFFFAAHWHNETQWGEGHRVVAGWFVPDSAKDQWQARAIVAEASEEEAARGAATMLMRAEQSQAALTEWKARAEKAEGFKAWVHAFLDGKQVPHDPDPAANAEHGCRISGRMKWVFDQLTALRELLRDCEVRRRETRHANSRSGG